MVREKAFDPAVALDRAMHVFWKHGYEKTSVSDLLAALGINRGSLYDTFGDKSSLFAACLSRYGDVYIARVVDTLAQPLPVHPTLERLFHNVTDLVHEDQANWGCLIVNTANELSIHDARIADMVTANFVRLEMAFAGFLQSGQTRGEIPAATDTAAAAKFLVSAFAGLATLAKTNLPAAFMKDAVRVILQSI